MKNAWIVVSCLLLPFIAGCGGSPAGRLEMKLVWGCEPSFEEATASVDSWCLYMFSTDGRLLERSCEQTISALEIAAEPDSQPVVLALEGLDSTDTPLLRGVGLPFRLSKSDESEVKVPLAPVGQTMAISGTAGGCSTLPHAVASTPAPVMPSGHVIVPGTPDPAANPGEAALVMDPVTYDVFALGTPAGMVRIGHAAAAVDGGVVAVFGGRTGAQQEGTDSVFVLRNGEPFGKPYDPGADYGGAFFEQSTPLLAKRAGVQAAVFYGKQVLVYDGQSPPEMWFAEREESMYLQSAGPDEGFPPTLGNIAPSVMAVSDDVAALAGGVQDHQGILRVQPDEAIAGYVNLDVADAARNRPVTVRLSAEKVMFLGGLRVLTHSDAPGIIVDVGGKRAFTMRLDSLVDLPREGFTATAIDEKTVFVAGGVGDGNFEPANTFLLVQGEDEKSWEVVPGPKLRQPRAYHAAAKLYDGRIVLIGGFDASATPPELNDAVSRSAEVVTF